VDAGPISHFKNADLILFLVEEVLIKQAVWFVLLNLSSKDAHSFEKLLAVSD
jgi:hypothetical protein